VEVIQVFNTVKLAVFLVASPWVFLAFPSPAQTQATGLITGAVTDVHGAVVVGAEVSTENAATGERRSAMSDQTGTFVVAFLPPAEYHLSIAAPGFATATYNNVTVVGTSTTTLNVTLNIAPASMNIEVNDAPAMIQSLSPELAITLESPTLTALPLPTRNFLQLATLAPGVNMPVTDNRTVGRNSQNFSVNGARPSQNWFQINGVDANDNAAHDLQAVPIPAPETISEVTIRTSLYEASLSGSGGGNVQVTTQGGTNLFHGSAYEYFRNDALNANDPDLIAAGLGRPVLRNNIFGLTLGGPIRKTVCFYSSRVPGDRRDQRCK
jgi:hypothetical protein